MSEGRTYFIARAELLRVFNPRAAGQFEELQQKLAETEETSGAGVGATQTLQQATFVTLSPNAELPNEYVLLLGEGLHFVVDAGEHTVTIHSDGPRVEGGHSLSFVVAGNSSVVVPLAGVLATRDAVETLENKTLAEPRVSGLGNYANDAAAAAGGVEITGLYRNGSQLMVRVA